MLTKNISRTAEYYFLPVALSDFYSWTHYGQLTPRIYATDNCMEMWISAVYMNIIAKALTLRFSGNIRGNILIELA